MKAEHAGEERQGLDAGVPVPLVDGLLQRIAFKALLILKPTTGLDHVERVGAGHEDLGDQGVRIERDGGHQLFDLRHRDGVGGWLGRLCAERDR